MKPEFKNLKPARIKSCGCCSGCGMDSDEQYCMDCGGELKGAIYCDRVANCHLCKKCHKKANKRTFKKITKQAKFISELRKNMGSPMANTKKSKAKKTLDKLVEIGGKRVGNIVYLNGEDLAKKGVEKS